MHISVFSVVVWDLMFCLHSLILEYACSMTRTCTMSVLLIVTSTSMHVFTPYHTAHVHMYTARHSLRRRITVVFVLTLALISLDWARLNEPYSKPPVPPQCPMFCKYRKWFLLCMITNWNCFSQHVYTLCIYMQCTCIQYLECCCPCHAVSLKQLVMYTGVEMRVFFRAMVGLPNP